MAPSCERCGVNSLSARRQEGVRARERRRREGHKPRKAIEVKKTQALIEDVAPEHIRSSRTGSPAPRPARRSRSRCARVIKGLDLDLYSARASLLNRPGLDRHSARVFRVNFA